MKGFAVLPMVLSLSLIISVVVAALAFLGFTESTQSTKQRDGNLAFFVAQAGIADGQVRVTRNLNFESTGYAVTTGSYSANVVVQKDTFSSPCTAASVGGVCSAGTRKDCIVSTGTVKSAKRRIEVVANLTCNGKVTVDSLKEISP